MENLRVRRELITPISAQHYLNLSKSNRNINAAKVDRYAKDMINGKWVEATGETIKVSNTNVLLDGHHRLMAVIKSDKSIIVDIAYDLNNSVFSVIDTGKSRNSSDCFKIAGISYATTLPTIITHDYYLGLNTTKYSQSNCMPTNDELLDIYLGDTMFWDDVAYKATVWYHKIARIVPPGILGGVYAHLYDKDEVIAERFMDELCSGVNITHSCINLIRNLLIKDNISTKKIPIRSKLAFIIKAWNLYASGKQVNFLRYNPAEEKFPIAIKPNLL